MTCPHIQTIAGYVRARSIAYIPFIYMKRYFTIQRKGDIIAFVMVFVDKSCATTSTWKPGPGAVSFNN